MTMVIKLTPVFLFVLVCIVVSCHSAQDNAGSSFGAPGDSLNLTGSHPAWSIQSNIYEVNLRQYSGDGSFRNFAKALPRLKDMGVEVLWFMPINTIGIEGRKASQRDLGSYYAVKDYYAVNPEFGSLEDWEDLVKQAHSMGFKVLMDWVANHSSPDNTWMTAHPDFYKRDSLGRAIIPNGWDDTRKLDYNNRALHDSMINAMKYWISASNIDGYRCDDAGDVPDEFWKDAISALRKIKPVFMLAEGDKPSLHADGFDETYPWSVMNVAYGIYSGKTSLDQLDSVINRDDSIFPKNSLRLYFTTNHDENSWNGTEFERFGDDYKAFAIWAFTMKNSVPLIYSGQEIPNKKRLLFFRKDTIEWRKYELAGFYKTLNRLRRSSSAFAEGSSILRLKTGKDSSVYAFMRRGGGHQVLVLLNFSRQIQEFSINKAELNGWAEEIFTGRIQSLNSSTNFRLTPGGFQVFNYDRQ